MRKLIILTFMLTTLPLFAQHVIVDIPGLSEKATETVDVTLDGAMLKLAARFLSDSDPDERAARDMVRNLTGIYVRSYQFDKDGQYDRASIDRVRSQLGPTWKKVIDVRSKVKENVEIYIDGRGDQITGLMVISAEPRELTLVNIVGPIDLERLAALEGEFGIPKISSGGKEHGHDD
jgi:hypothetical protein